MKKGFSNNWRVGIQRYQPNFWRLSISTRDSMNKQQLTTAKVPAGQSWKASGATPTWGELVGRNESVVWV